MIIFLKFTEVFSKVDSLEQQKCFRMSIGILKKSLKCVLNHKFVKCYIKLKSIYVLLIYKYSKTYFTTDPFFVKEYTSI